MNGEGLSGERERPERYERCGETSAEHRQRSSSSWVAWSEGAGEDAEIQYLRFSQCS